MFRPRESHDQRILGERLVILPEPASLRFIHDTFGNCVGIARFLGEAAELSFESTVELDHRPWAPPGEVEAHDAEPYPVAYPPDELPDLMRSIEGAHPDPERVLAAWARRFVGAEGGGVLGLLSAMTHAIHREFRYAKRLDGGTQAPLDTLRRGSGTCRDFAVLMIEAARSLDLAARFASGYIYSGERHGRGRAGGGHTHAWARVYLPSHGWVDFDPTNGIVGSTDLIRVGIGRDARQTTPLSGVWTGNPWDYIGMEVEVDVRVKRPPAAIRRVA